MGLMKRIAALGVAAALLAGGEMAALAQPGGMSQDDAAKIEAMGTELTMDVIRGTMAIYGPKQAQMPTDGVTVKPDLAYGDHPRNVLDLYVPEAADDAPPPILIFMHGGGFVQGDKSDGTNIGYYFARHGVVTASLSYRLAPEFRFPSGSEDLAAAIAWLREHPEEHGGDINRIFLMGHSAGAAHVVNYAVFEDLQLEADGVAGMILVSGPTYDSANLNPFVDLAYYGMDESAWPAMSAIDALEGRKIPALLAYAEYDMESIHAQNRAMIDALTDRDGRLPPVYTALGHNHISITAAINTGDEGLSGTILEFIALNPAGQ
ncbi:alpha/beta hydrolase [Cucumibacter marinus]|uniref:alpha/beta hydrolase n=1 Tax=Cucumibacter marinus TaxID=1121252 RepID=UPI0004195B4E|nr:alpha/beta hydrolase [Cucumibacter marinus]